MSNGYTNAFAMTAPVAPATARPQGGSVASLDCPAIMMGLRKWSSRLYFEKPAGLLRGRKDGAETVSKN